MCAIYGRPSLLGLHVRIGTAIAIGLASRHRLSVSEWRKNPIAMIETDSDTDSELYLSFSGPFKVRLHSSGRCCGRIYRRLRH